MTSSRFVLDEWNSHQASGFPRKIMYRTTGAPQRHIEVHVHPSSRQAILLIVYPENVVHLFRDRNPVFDQHVGVPVARGHRVFRLPIPLLEAEELGGRFLALHLLDGGHAVEEFAASHVPDNIARNCSSEMNLQPYCRAFLNFEDVPSTVPFVQSAFVSRCVVLY